MRSLQIAGRMLPAALALALVAVVPFSAPEVTTAVSTASHDVAPATKVLTLEGTRVPFVKSTPVQTTLRGEICKGEFVCEAVDYPASLSFSSASRGVQALSADLQEATEPVVVFGFSQGASVAIDLMIARDRGKMPEAVVPESYVFIGNPHHGLNGISKIKNFENPHPTTDISVEFDLFSDFPNNPFNMLAVANAFAGTALAHRLGYQDVDVNSYDNLIYQDGQTTYILVPTKNLPILQGWRDIGLGFIADALEAPFRESINRAYDRSMYEVQTPPQEVVEEEEPQQDTPRARATMVMDEPSFVQSESPESDSVEQQVQSVVSTSEEEGSAEQSKVSEPVSGFDRDDTVEAELPEPEVQQEEIEDRSSRNTMTDDEEESILDDEDVTEDIDVDVDVDVDVETDGDDDDEKPKQRFGESSFGSDDQSGDSGDDNSSSDSDSDSDSDSSSSDSGSEE